MARTGVGVRVYIDNNVLDDGSINANDGISADDNLNVTWGRAATTEQPEASTCTFRVTDIPGNRYFDHFKIGSTVAVYAVGMSYDAADLIAFDDPNIEENFRVTGLALKSEMRAIYFDIDDYRVHGIILPNPLTTETGFIANLPPGALENPTDENRNPLAWIHIPELGGGQTWRINTRIFVPQYTAAELRPIVYSGPYANAATPLPTIAYVSGQNEWQEISAEISPGVDSGWLGLQIRFSAAVAWTAVDQSEGWKDGYNVPYWGGGWDANASVLFDTVEILAPEGTVEIRHPVFGGRITDMSSAAAGEYPQIDITAVDFQAELENRFIGDVPWNTSATLTVDKRAARVLELAAAAGDDRPFILIVDDDAKNYSLVPDDVDHRAAWGILHDMAISVDAVLWSGVQHNNAPFIRYEDPNSRPSMNKLGLNDENEVVIQPLDPEHWPEERRPVDIDACEVLRNPVTFTQNVSDIATRISVRWNKEEYNEAGNLTGNFVEATETLIDTAREEQYGTRSISVQTLLAFQALAPTEIAERTLARVDGRWRIEGIEIADAYLDNPNLDTAKKLYALLDNERRQGLGIRFGNLPAWSPFGKAVSAYLEGGEYRFVEGGWELALNVSTATGAGKTIPWNQLTEPWPWDQFAETVTWVSLRGVGGVE